MAKAKTDEFPKYTVVPTILPAGETKTFLGGDTVTRGDFPAHVTDADFDRLVLGGHLKPAE